MNPPSFQKSHSLRGVSPRPGLAVALGLALLCGPLTAAPPVVSNIRASQRAGTQVVDIYYNVSDPDSGSVTVYVAISAELGANE